MPATPGVVDHAEQSIAVGSKSFAAAAKLFAPETRESAVLLYAWCRHCDDVIDGQELGHGQVEGDRRAGQERLAELERLTRAAYGDEPLQDPAFAAFQRVVRRHGIPLALPLDHLAGFRMDVEERVYVELEDTLEYCYHVAGVVGVMMARIMGAEDEETLDRACDLGMAFQLTNIARDIVEDARIGRLYLPRLWLDELGVPADELAEPRHREAVAQLAERLDPTWRDLRHRARNAQRLLAYHDDHQALVEALDARDPVRAAAVMRAHLRALQLALDSVLQQTLEQAL